MPHFLFQSHRNNPDDAKSFIIRTSKNRDRNSFRIRTSKMLDLKSFRIRTYEKGGGEGSELLTSRMAHLLSFRT